MWEILTITPGKFDFHWRPSYPLSENIYCSPCNITDVLDISLTLPTDISINSHISNKLDFSAFWYHLLEGRPPAPIKENLACGVLILTFLKPAPISRGTHYTASRSEVSQSFLMMSIMPFLRFLKSSSNFNFI